MREDLLFQLEQFSGQLPLFPLPNVVFFPQTLLPLHVFEDRYRLLVGDALRGERLVGMVLLKPGWKDTYKDTPDIFPVACLGRIIKHSQFKDGRYNIVLMGLRRVRIVSEIQKKPYRRATVKVLNDVYKYKEADARRIIEIRNQLTGVYMELCERLCGEKEKIRKILESSLPLGLLVDVLTATLEFDIYKKQEILSQVDVIRRAQLLFSLLSQHQYEPAPTLPDLIDQLQRPFSTN